MRQYSKSRAGCALQSTGAQKRDELLAVAQESMELAQNKDRRSPSRNQARTNINKALPTIYRVEGAKEEAFVGENLYDALEEWWMFSFHCPDDAAVEVTITMPAVLGGYQIKVVKRRHMTLEELFKKAVAAFEKETPA